MGTNSLHEAVHLARILDSRAEFDTGTYINDVGRHESHRRTDGLRGKPACEGHSRSSQAFPRAEREWKTECNTCAAVGMRHARLDEDRVGAGCRIGHPIEVL